MIAPLLFVLAAAPAAGAPASPAPAFQRLYSDHVEASSFLQNDWNRYTENYHPNYVLDDDPKTAWVEGSPGNGVGQTITLRFSPLSSARTVRVRIRNGYQRSKDLLAANAAAKDVTLSLLNAAGEEVFRTHDTLSRTSGWQQVDLTPPARTPVAFLKLRIDSVWPGARYKDTCLSDVQLWVDSDVPYNAKVELAKKAALTAWIRDRWATAKYFAALPRSYPFAATHFDAHTDLEQSESNALHPDGAGHKAVGWLPLAARVQQGVYSAAWKRLFDPAQSERIRRLMRLAQEDEDGPSPGEVWYRPVFKGHVRLPDGLPSELAAVADLLERDNFALFEASQAVVPGQPSPAEGAVETGDQREASQLRVTFRQARAASVGGKQVEGAPLPVKESPRIQEISFWRRTIFDDRMGSEETQHLLVCFNERERPSEVLLLSEDDSGWRVTALSFALDGKGRVTTVTARSAMEGEGRSSTFRKVTYSPSRPG